MCLWWEQSSGITYFPHDCDTLSLSDISQVQNQILQISLSHSTRFWHMFSLLKVAEISNVRNKRDHARLFCFWDKISSRLTLCFAINRILHTDGTLFPKNLVKHNVKLIFFSCRPSLISLTTEQSWMNELATKKNFKRQGWAFSFSLF